MAGKSASKSAEDAKKEESAKSQKSGSKLIAEPEPLVPEKAKPAEPSKPIVNKPEQPKP